MAKRKRFQGKQPKRRVKRKLAKKVVKAKANVAMKHRATAEKAMLMDRRVKTREVGTILDVGADPFDMQLKNHLGLTIKHYLSGIKQPYFKRVRHTYRMIKQAVFDGVNLVSQKGSINLNNMFDPDPNVGGNQPSGRDHFASIYDAYIVLGGSVKVTLQNDLSGLNTVHGCISQLSIAQWVAVVSAGGTTRFLQNQKTNKAKHWQRTRLSGSVGTLADSNERKVISMKWNNPAQFLDIQEPLATQGTVRTRFAALSGAEPAQNITLQLFGHKSFDDTVVSSGINARFEITYDCMWYGPTEQAGHND